MRFSLRTLMIIAASIPPLAGGLWHTAHDKRRITQMDRIAICQMLTMKSALNVYCQHVGELPTELEALISVPDLENPTKWQGPYFEQNEIPLDPWNSGYQYQVLDPFKNRFRLWSKGPDRVFGTPDDLEVSSNNS